MATMTKPRTRSVSNFKNAAQEFQKRATALSDSHQTNSLPREAEPLEESVQCGEEPEFRQQVSEEAPDAGIGDLLVHEGDFTHGRSRS